MRPIKTVLGYGVPPLATPLLVLCLTSFSPPSATAQSFAVRQVRVFDGVRLHTDMTVVVRDGIIRSVQADTVIPPGIEMIDGTGRTLLPGLFDSHTHTWGNGLTQALAFGVTTVLDMFTDPSWVAERREEQEQGGATGTSLRMLAEREVPILAGSDPPNSGTAWGASIHRELELMVQAGLSPTAALQAATSVPARVFDLDDRGRVAPGLRADLLLVDGDPTANILTTRNIVAIWKQGMRFDREAYSTALEREGDP